MKILSLFLLLLSVSLYPLEKFPFSQEYLKQHDLVDIQSMDSNLVVKLMYATTNNFLGKNVYSNLDRCYLRLEAAVKLTNAARILDQKYPGHRLLIYDGLRPRRIQYQMWEAVKNSFKRIYVANPAHGSIHNYGAAVDLTIMDTNGTPADMGTGFDYFGPKAEPRYEYYFMHPENIPAANFDPSVKERILGDLKKSGPLTPDEVTNRLILRNIMREAGFEPIVNEWWHFDAFPVEITRKIFDIIE